MARPQIEIDKQKFELLCTQHLSKEAIRKALWVGDTRTIDDWCMRTYNSSFSEVLEQKREEGNAILINKALKLAEKNGAVMIFLLKNWCGMSDQVEIKADTSLMETLIDVMKIDNNNTKN